MNFLKNFKIRTKLLASTGLTILLFLIALGIFLQSLNSTSRGYSQVISEELETVSLAKELHVQMLESRRSEKDFLARLDMKYLERVEKHIAALQGTATQINSLAQRDGAEEIAELASQVKELAGHYHAAFEAVVKGQQKKGLDHKSGLQGQFANAASQLMGLAGIFDEQLARLLALRRYEKNYLLRHDQQYVKKVHEQLIVVHDSLLEISWDKDTKDRTEAAVASYKRAFDALVAEDGRAKGLMAEMTQATHAIEPLVGKITTLAHELGRERISITEHSVRQAARMALIVAVLALVAGLILSFYIANVISRPLQNVVTIIKGIAKGDFSTKLTADSKDETGMIIRAMGTMVANLNSKAELANKIANKDLRDDVELASDRDSLGHSLQAMTDNLNQVINEINVAAEQIASGSGQVADASQALSQGATEQAASLEQITSSMTEMASQTKNNAENAGQANNLAEETREAAQRGHGQMQDMVTAMGEISQSGQSISKIIKTIDEIAFQTNLLALNAAVEAARAGRHGKGFAVVAEEVRNLAARSAKAAKETAELIEGSVEKTNNGSEIANRTADALDEIVTSVGKVTDLVAEIAAASSEQAEGIGQVNIGISQVDQVTQQNTANAEEGASAAEELSSQAEQLKEMMSCFRIKGQASAGGPRQLSSFSGPEAYGREQPQFSAPPIPAKTVKPADVIDLDDQEFGKF